MAEISPNRRALSKKVWVSGVFGTFGARGRLRGALLLLHAAAAHPDHWQMQPPHIHPPLHIPSPPLAVDSAPSMSTWYPNPQTHPQVGFPHLPPCPAPQQFAPRISPPPFRPPRTRYLCNPVTSGDAFAAIDIYSSRRRCFRQVSFQMVQGFACAVRSKFARYAGEGLGCRAPFPHEILTLPHA